MSFIFFFVLAWFVASMAWTFVTAPEKRAEMIEGIKERPARCIFLFVYISAIFLFVIGIVAPIFGEAEFFDTGLTTWQIGGLAALGCWVIDSFMD